ncbi:MAG: response regulator transcription factor, partial [Bacillota bacterium]
MNSSVKNELKRHVLVVEDEEDIVRLIAFHLEKEGYRVTGTGNGREALELANETLPGLVILDIMLPEMDGLEVCRRLRAGKDTAKIPILILSAKKEELDKVLGLELGADDYMVKPFSVRELVARVRAIFRRFGQKEDEEIQVAEKAGTEERVLRMGDITLYPERHQVMVNDEQRILTHKEFILLELLMENAGKVLT